MLSPKPRTRLNRKGPGCYPVSFEGILDAGQLLSENLNLVVQINQRDRLANLGLGELSYFGVQWRSAIYAERVRLFVRFFAIGTIHIQLQFSRSPTRDR